MDHSLRLTATGGLSARPEGVTYLRRLVALRIQRRLRRLAGFVAVGAIGVAVNTGVLALLTREMHTWYLIASFLATQIAILSNFALTEWIVFRGTKTDKSLRFRFASYVLINTTSLLISGPLLLLLVSALRMDVLLANVLALVLLCLGRFAIADSYIWGSKSPGPGRRALTETHGEHGSAVAGFRADTHTPRDGCASALRLSSRTQVGSKSAATPTTRPASERSFATPR